MAEWLAHAPAAVARISRRRPMSHEPANYEHIRRVLNALDCEPCEIEHVDFTDDGAEVTVRCDDETVHQITLTTVKQPWTN